MGVGEGVIAVAALQAGIAGRLAYRDPPEEGVKGPLHPQEHILQHLRMPLGVFRAGRLEVGQLRLLLVLAGRDALAERPWPRCPGRDALPALPPHLAFLQGAVVMPTPAPQAPPADLRCGWVQWKRLL